jgi:type I restriction enzyme R subunit
LSEADQVAVRGKLDDYTRLYAFLSQLIPFADADLEKLHVYARLLRRRIPAPREELPREIQQNIDMDAYAVRQASSGSIGLARGVQALDPIGAGAIHQPAPADMEPLSRIIQELNAKFGTDFTDEDRVFIQNLENRLGANDALKATVRVSPPENARLSFERFVERELQGMVDTNFQFYKRVTDDREFGKYFVAWLFERYRRSLG